MKIKLKTTWIKNYLRSVELSDAKNITKLFLKKQTKKQQTETVVNICRQPHKVFKKLTRKILSEYLCYVNRFRENGFSVESRQIFSLKYEICICYFQNNRS